MSLFLATKKKISYFGKKITHDSLIIDKNLLLNKN